MTSRSHDSPKQSIAGQLAWGILAFVGALSLGGLLLLPLPWKFQAIFGAVSIGLCLLLHWSSRSRAVTLALMVISMFSTFRYGYWRVVQTYDGLTSAGHLWQWDTFFVLLLLAAEFYAFATLVLGYFQTLRPLRRGPVPIVGQPQNWPRVDVFIPTYNESLTVVRATVLGALALDYPNFKVYLLDDGKRPEFADFCKQVGAVYITRNNNAHAKAGNINHALGMTSGDLVAIFDCDHIPTRSFLKATVGWFQKDRRLGLVQTPHHFYSPDPFERNLGQFRKIPNEGELFHRLIQDGNDLWNASFFCGSCAVLRREALREIGGIAVETVTEDAHTALRMQRCGWNTAYINIPQAAGLATETLAAHIGQRIRWARGMIQILRTENPLFTKGLSLAQRFCYFNATTHFLFALPRLIFLVMPLVYLLFGIVNIYGYSLAVFAYALPHIVLSNLTNSRVQGVHRFSFWNEIYEAVLAPYILFPTLLAMINPRLGKFNVTSKGGINPKSYFDRRIAWPFLLLLGLNFAGLAMAAHRYVVDPYHHDTVLMNTVWTAYNVTILAVAASVAWEKKQRRSLVRVNVRIPLRLTLPGGQQVAGVTAQLSGRGATAHLGQVLELTPGVRVRLAMEGSPAGRDIPALVTHSSRRHLHLLFPQLSLEQEMFIVSQIYSRPEAWVSWHRSRGVDMPLLSLANIFWLALRGSALVFVGLFTPRPRESESQPPAREKERAPAVAASLVLMALLMGSSLRASAELPARSPASPPQTTGGNATGAFHDRYVLAALASYRQMTMSGAGSSQNLFLDMPLTKIINAATLDLQYNAPQVRPGESTMEIWLNGTRVESIALRPGWQRSVIPLPSDLLTSNNIITFQLQGKCIRCLNSRTAWVTIDPNSELALAGTRLNLPNNLALLPVPFFDSAIQHSWSLPIIFAEQPDLTTTKAAAIVASWFGIFSDYRGVRFPVSVGNIPQGNAVVLTTRDSQLAQRLAVPAQPGAVLAIRDNPNDPYSKLLVLAGDAPADLVTAARALVTRNNAQKPVDASYVGPVKLPQLNEYSAPRWLDASKPVPIGMYTTAERLTAKGSSSISIYFRIPPDLFLQARESVPLVLKYSYSGVGADTSAALHIRLNDNDVDSIHLKPAYSNVDREDLIRLPTGRLQPYTNTLTIDVDFGNGGPPPHTWRYAAIHRETTIDLSRLPHSVVLPRLELFADSGYPFTAWPDLRRTAVVMSNSPDATEYEDLLDMMGFFGAQTGAPVLRVTLTDPAHVDEVQDKDLVLLGGAQDQPLYAQWRSSMPLQLIKPERVNTVPAVTRLEHPEWPFRSGDRDRLAEVVGRTRGELIVENFVSPLHPKRSVVALVPRSGDAPEAVAALFTPALDKGPVYGGVAIANRARFESFLVGPLAFYAGRVNAYERVKILLVDYYLAIPVLVIILGFLIAGWLYTSTERVAARRLSLGRTQEAAL